MSVLKVEAEIKHFKTIYSTVPLTVVTSSKRSNLRAGFAEPKTGAGTITF